MTDPNRDPMPPEQPTGRNGSDERVWAGSRWFDGRNAPEADDADLPEPEPLPEADSDGWLFERPERPEPTPPLREVTAPTDTNQFGVDAPAPIAGWSFSALRDAAGAGAEGAAEPNRPAAEPGPMSGAAEPAGPTFAEPVAAEPVDPKPADPESVGPEAPVAESPVPAPPVSKRFDDAARPGESNSAVPAPEPGRTPFWGTQAARGRGTEKTDPGAEPGVGPSARPGPVPPGIGRSSAPLGGAEPGPGGGRTPFWGSPVGGAAPQGPPPAPGPPPPGRAPRFAPAHTPPSPSVTQGQPYVPSAYPPGYPGGPGGGHPQVGSPPPPYGLPAPHPAPVSSPRVPPGYPPAPPPMPHPSQPYPGQPHPGQPHFNQPNPNQPNPNQHYGYPAPTGSHVRFAPHLPPAPPPWQPARSGATPRPSALPPKPEADITTGAHRLHGATVALQAIVVALVFFALPGPVLLDFGVLWTLLLTVAVGLGTAAYALVAWWNTSFGLKDDHLVLHTGLLRRVSREIPLSRLQAVDVVRPLFMQVIGLAELRVELAGGDSSEIRLRYLGRGQADRLRASMLAHAAGLSGRTPEAPESPLYKLPFSLLIGALAFRIPVLAAFALFMLLIVAGLAFGELGVLGGAIPLLLGLMRGFLGPLLRYIDFYASLSPDGLRLRYGVFQARMQTVPPGRVQAVRIVEPLLWRFLKVVRVEANVAGYVGERQMDSSTLLPVVPRSLAYALVRELFPGTDVSSAVLHPAHRGLLGEESLGVDDTLFVTRRGLFCRVVEVVPHSRMQTLRLTMGPLARRLGTATVEVETPPGPVRARAPRRELTEARRVVDGVAARAERARGASSGPERWATRSDPHFG